MNFTFLGTGTSHGVPMIGCECDVCTSTEPKNKRRRCSLYIITEGQHLIIDTPPDFREQVLTFGVKEINAAFITHPHADHIMGFDDIRRFSALKNQHIPVYGSPTTIQMMRTIFHYVDKGYNFQSVPRVQFKEQHKTVSIGKVKVTPLSVQHGQDSIYGYLVEGDNKRLAYIPDCNSIPETTMKLLTDIDIMILDGLRPQPHPTHFSTSESLAHLKIIGAKQSFITHLTHDCDHYKLQDKVGNSVTVPWDGLQIRL